MVTMATIVSIRNVRWSIDGGYTVHTVIREWEDTQQSTGGATQQIYCWILQSILQSVRKCGCVEYEYEDMQDRWVARYHSIDDWLFLTCKRKRIIYLDTRQSTTMERHNNILLIGYCNSYEIAGTEYMLING